MKQILNKTTLIILLIGLAAGFFLSRQIYRTEEKVAYRRGVTVRDTVKVPLKPTETIPPKPNLPLIRDTIWVDSIIYVTEKVDTNAIINDYIISREYAVNLFDNKTEGKLTVWPTVQYNTLAGLKYEYMPMVKEVTKIVDRKFVPFLSMSYIYGGYVGVGGGFFYRNIGLEYKLNIKASPNILSPSQPNLFNNQKVVHELGIKYKL